MGFRPEPTIYKLTFDESSGLEGLRLRIKSCTIRQFNDMLAWSGTDVSGTEAAENNHKMAELFVSKLVEWNIEDPESGDPVPMTVDGFESLESHIVRSMVASWQMALVGVPNSLKNGSTNGRSLEEVSLDLANSSTSHQN